MSALCMLIRQAGFLAVGSTSCQAARSYKCDILICHMSYTHMSYNNNNNNNKRPLICHILMSYVICGYGSS